VEYLQDKNEDLDIEALGPAGPGATRLQDLQLTDDETPASSMPPPELPDIEMPDKPCAFADQ